MVLFRVQTVEAEIVTLQLATGATLMLPLSCFEHPPVLGQEIRLLAVPATPGQPLPLSLARSLLNELLTPSTP